jgi:hypothetical protein
MLHWIKQPAQFAFDCVSQCSNKCIKSDYFDICKFSLYIQCFKILYRCIKWTCGLLKLRISREQSSLLYYAYEDYHVYGYILQVSGYYVYMKEFENLILNCFFKVEYCPLYEYTIIFVRYLSELSTLWLCKVHIFGSVHAMKTTYNTTIRFGETKSPNS